MASGLDWKYSQVSQLTWQHPATSFYLVAQSNQHGPLMPDTYQGTVCIMGQPGPSCLQPFSVAGQTKFETKSVILNVYFDLFCCWGGTCFEKSSAGGSIQLSQPSQGGVTMLSRHTVGMSSYTTCQGKIIQSHLRLLCHLGLVFGLGKRVELLCWSLSPF